MKKIRKYKWFWAWQDEKEEAWLSEMAKQGLHLESLPFPGIYEFRKGDPGDYIYRLDFQSLQGKDRESYLQLFDDAGWEHIGDMGGWVYFRHLVNGSEIPDIYSDLESKIGKYQRILVALAIFLPIMIFLTHDSEGVTRFGSWFIIVELLQAILYLLWAFAMVRLFLRINTLKKKNNESS